MVNKYGRRLAGDELAAHNAVLYNMDDYIDLATLAAELAHAKKVAIFTHVRPDADAVGCQAAGSLLLAGRGIASTIVHMGELPESLAFLSALAPSPAVHFSPAWAREHLESFDCLLVVDTSAREQLEPAMEFLTGRADKIIAMDHHLVGDLPCRGVFRDTTAAACVEIMAELFRILDVPIDANAATPLLAGLVADTGWFRFDNVTTRSHELAARLLRAGASAADIYSRLAQRESRAKLELIKRALQSIRWFNDDAIAVTSISQADMASCCAQPWQTEGLVDYPLMVANVVVSVFLAQTAPGKIRASLRSKRDVDVSKVSARFGGGGHARAAGCRLDGSLETACEALVRGIREQWNRAAPA